MGVFNEKIKVGIGPDRSSIEFEKIICPVSDSYTAKRIKRILELRGYRLKTQNFRKFHHASVFSDKDGNFYFSERNPENVAGDFKAVSVKDICGNAILNKDFIMGLCIGVIFALVITFIF